MSTGNESERTNQLQTIIRPASAACQNVFDTSSLALTDMEQANIAYGRNYVRLELAETDFLPPAATMAASRSSTPTASAIRLGADTATTRIERVRSRGMSTLLRTDGFIARDPHDKPLPRAMSADGITRAEGTTAAAQLLPVVKATSLGLRRVVGWLSVPNEGAPAEPPPNVEPALYVVQRFRLATYARGFGLGDHLYSFTLFPEEAVEIEIKTWKSQEQVDKTGSSIFDGQSDSAESDFENAVQQENAKTTKKDKSFEAHVEASGEASWGIGSASAQAGAKYATAESTEQFAKNVSSATQKVANKANRERRVEITQSSEVKTTEGEETRTTRKINNLNKCNTLNFNYFQLVRKYETRLELHDVKVRYASGLPYFDDEENAWHYEAEEVSLAELDALLERALVASAVPTVKDAICKMLGPDDGDGLDVLTAASTPERMRLDVVPLAALVAWEDAARSAANSGVPAPPKPTAKVPRLMSRDERVIATNAVYVDSMLGKCNACDDFIQDSRIIEVESAQLNNRSKEVAVERARLELEHYRTDPNPKRVVRFEGLPESSTIHVRLDERSDCAPNVAVDRAGGTESP